jgi:glycosyltransferase involved in cell wall biosynthesis
MVATMPPVFLAAAVRFGASLTGASFIYHVMDIYPEAAVINNRIQEGLLTRWARKIDRKNCSRAIKVVVLSEDMRDTLAERGASVSNVQILNNFQLESFGNKGHLPDAMRKPEGSFRLLFAGNIGRSQSLNTVITAFSDLDDLSGLRLDILGDGAARKTLELQAGERLGRNIFFHGYQPIENAIHMIATADLSLITLNPELYRIAYPSKTMSYLASGSPLLVMVEERSSLARMVRTEGVGYVSPQGEADALAMTIRQAYEDTEGRQAMRTRALSLAVREFTADAVLPKWAKLFQEISQQRALSGAS